MRNFFLWLEYAIEHSLKGRIFWKEFGVIKSIWVTIYTYPLKYVGPEIKNLTTSTNVETVQLFYSGQQSIVNSAQ